MKELLQPFIKMLAAVTGLLLSVTLLLVVVLVILVEVKPRTVNAFVQDKARADNFFPNFPKPCYLGLMSCGWRRIGKL